MDDENLLRARALMRRSPEVSAPGLVRGSGVTQARAQQMLDERDDDEDDDEDDED